MKHCRIDDCKFLDGHRGLHWDPQRGLYWGTEERLLEEIELHRDWDSGLMGWETA